MTPDPIDRLHRRLFDAARGELPPEGAEQRLLAATLREAHAIKNSRPSALRRGLATGLVATAVLIAAGMALRITRRDPSYPISAEPAAARSAARKAPAVAELAETATARIEPATEASTVSPRLAAPLPSASTTVTLSDEIDALKVASTALNAGNGPAALAALDRYDHQLKGSKLRAEATILRIQALARSGNAQAASDLAQRFVDGNPDSPLVDRARSFIETGSGGN
jgi:hypothetical protein